MPHITIHVSENNEATAYPWWVIIDPHQMMKPSVHAVGAMITGPFFSREAAEGHLEARRYAFSKNASVYCHSGHRSTEYVNAFQEARKPQAVS